SMDRGASGSASAMSKACASRRSRNWSRRARRADASGACPIWPRVREPARRRSSCLRGRGRATRSWTEIVAWLCGSSASQRPGTANGIVFILLEDEHGTVNLIVPAQVYERHRLVVRTEPLMLIEGKLEKLPAAGGAINVLVDRVGSIAAPDQILAEVKDFSMLDEQVRRGRAAQEASRRDPAREGEAAEDFRAVAPPV